MFNFIFLFFLAFFPRFGNIDFVFLVAFLILFYDILNKRTLILNKFFLNSIFIIFLILPFSFFSFLLNQEVFGLFRLTKLILLLLLVPYTLNRIDEIFVYKWFTIFLLLNISILYIEYFNIFGLRITVNSIQDFLHLGREVTYRAKGLFPGYSAAGVSCGFISLYALFFTLKGSINKLYGVPLFVFSYLATFFTGRTGIFIASFGIIIFVIYFYRKIFNLNLILRLIIICFIIHLIYPLIFPHLDLENITITSIRTFEVFLNYHDSGSFSSESTTQVARTFKLPDNISVLLLGNGYQHWSTQAIHDNIHCSDSGLVQTLFIYGLFSLILYYFPLFYIYLVHLRLNFSGSSYFYIITTIPLALISEIKGHYVYSNLIFVLVLFPIFYRNSKIL